MRVRRIQLTSEHDISFELLDDDDQPIPIVSGFMRHLCARGCSPNTLSAYAYDFLHFMSFLQEQHLTYQEFRPPHAMLFLEYLSQLSSRKAARRLGLVLSTTTADGASATRLSPATINRTFAAVSSFYPRDAQRDRLVRKHSTSGTKTGRSSVDFCVGILA